MTHCNQTVCIPKGCIFTLKRALKETAMDSDGTNDMKNYKRMAILKSA